MLFAADEVMFLLLIGGLPSIQSMSPIDISRLRVTISKDITGFKGLRGKMSSSELVQAYSNSGHNDLIPCGLQFFYDMLILFHDECLR